MTQKRTRLAPLIACLFVVTASAGSRAAPARDTKAGTSPAGGRAERSQVADVLRSAHNFFEYGRHEKVVEILRPLIERGLIQQQADLVEALRMYGISLHLTGRKQAAQLVFRRMVDIDPSLRLDPRLVPPEVVTAYDRIRTQVVSQKMRKSHTEQRESYAVLNFLPPAGQFQNGQHLKAWLILAAEVTLIALSVTSYSILKSNKYRKDGSYVVQDVDGNIVEDHRPLAKAMLGVNYASFGLLVGTLIYGIIDGYVVMNRLEKKRKARRRFLQKQLSVTPTASPSSVGLSVSLSF